MRIILNKNDIVFKEVDVNQNAIGFLIVKIEDLKVIEKDDPLIVKIVELTKSLGNSISVQIKPENKHLKHPNQVFFPIPLEPEKSAQREVKAFDQPLNTIDSESPKKEFSLEVFYV